MYFNMDLFASIELLTQVATLAMFATGIPPCWHMYKTGNTRGVPYYFFLLGTVNSLMGLYYGVLINNAVILFLNIVGAVLNLFYSLIYIHVSRSKWSAVVQMFVGAFWLAVVWWYLSVYLTSADSVTYQLGLLLCLMTSVLLTSPVLEIVECIRSGSVADMSLAMLFGSMICSGLWLFYGMMLGDFFIYAPNFPGVATGLGKMALLFLYSGETKPKAKKVD